MNFITGIIIGAGLALIIAVWFLRRPRSDRNDVEERLEAIENRLSTELRQEMQNMRETFDRSRETFGERFERTSHMMQERVREFTAGVTSMKSELEKVGGHIKGVASFQELFRVPKLRGQWGEASLANILSQHYPGGLFALQHSFRSGERVDAILKLPNGFILPIDAKFPSENFAKTSEAESDLARAEYQKAFIQDVKARIDEVGSKYILPGEHTTDFALMYVPAERIYYEIINQIKEANLIEYAQSKKVIMTSPNTLYITLRVIEHWYKDAEFGREKQAILGRLEKIKQDAEKLKIDFGKLGKHLDNARSAYEGSEKRLDIMSSGMHKLIAPQGLKKDD